MSASENSSKTECNPLSLWKFFGTRNVIANTFGTNRVLPGLNFNRSELWPLERRSKNVYLPRRSMRNYLMVLHTTLYISCNVYSEKRKRIFKTIFLASRYQHLSRPTQKKKIAGRCVRFWKAVFQ